MSKETIDTLGIIYWVETIALSAFGIAWIVAGKAFNFIVDEEQKLRFFAR